MNDQEQHPPPATPGSGSGAPPPPPPAATPGSAPPPPPAAPLPWENRSQIGFGSGLVETIRLLMSGPTEAFDRARRKGDYESPLMWVAIIGTLMGIVTWLYSMMFAAPLMTLFPTEAQNEMGPLMALGIMGGGVFNVITYPIAAVIGTFIWAAIAHLCLLLVAGGGKSGAGFEGTFRASAYSQVAQIAGIIPVVGGLLVVVWNVILLVIGMASMHRISTGAAVLVVLIPLVIGCACIAAGFAGMVALMGMAAD